MQLTDQQRARLAAARLTTPQHAIALIIQTLEELFGDDDDNG
jgi:DNA-binding transcriptional LysR family regulator